MKYSEIPSQLAELPSVLFSLDEKQPVLSLFITSCQIRNDIMAGKLLVNTMNKIATIYFV